MKKYFINLSVRRDPITGGNVEEEEDEIEEKEVEKEETDDSTKLHEPHLGPVRNTSGVRCAQPPGGKSSVIFG